MASEEGLGPRLAPPVAGNDSVPDVLAG
ncbi:hypothetical protein FYA67_03710 [Bordetella holmesii]|nr:hypothetical protein FYB59_03710 [Bordetella holmesii]QGB16494.1 hypothetical protein FYB57_03710 [Bordetella holmesii]QGB65736.1 hypothetical protein FYB43_03710 [Bordetella holmesii]QGC44286.1 hypothetical protein FYB19_03710 [Bordetella holmesii]QGC64198.1 hypothetical protein FYB13_03710 [Bordetella holmesii]